MKNNTVKFTSYLVVLAAVALLIVGDASAGDNAGAVAQRVFGQFGSFADVMVGTAFLGGVVIGISALFKFKAHGDNPQQNKIGPAIILAAVASCLIGLPAFLNMGKDSVLNGAASSASQTGVYTQIGGN